MKLLRLTLSNFQGVRDFTLDAKGKNVTIYGDNGAGKTTLASAWSWLLTDKDSLGRSDFEIKTLTPDGEAMHGMEHEVEAVLDIGLTLKKVYSEKWTKARGALKPTFSGHETKYYLDGVPVTKRAYDDRVAEIAPGDLLRLLTDPMAFNDLHWQRRREILLEVCGDVPDNEVIASDPKLAGLPEILGRRTMADHRAMVQVQRTKLAAEKRDTETRIKEVMHGLPDTEAPDAEKLKTLKAQLVAKEAERLRLLEGAEAAAKKKELAEAELEMLDMEGVYRREVAELTQGAKDKLRALQRTLLDVEADIGRLVKEKEEMDASLVKIWGNLHTAWEGRVRLLTLKFSGDGVCPTCGQALPEQQVEAARQKFRLQKRKQVDELNKELRALEESKETLEQQKEGVDNKLSDLDAARWDIKARMKETEEEIASQPPLPLFDNPKYTRLAHSVLALKKEIFALSEPYTGELDRAIAVLSASIAEQETLHRAAQKRKDAESRKAELQEKELALVKEYERLQRELWLCDCFMKAKVSMLDEKINSRFKLARFKLFAEQVNGELAEVCETTYNGVPWGKGLNAGAQIQVGIDIINTLSEHFGLTAPIFVDNAESVTVLPETEAQLIKLVKPEIGSEAVRNYYRTLEVVEEL